MKDLKLTSVSEQIDFFKSFDYILCDVDGVLCLNQEKISGSCETLNALKTLGKQVIFVTNNSTKTHDEYYNQLKSMGVKLEKSDLIQPGQIIVDFLKKRNFSKEIFLIGMTPLRTQLEKAGFTVENITYENPEESVSKFIKSCVTKNPNVGAVILDLDLNMTIFQLQRAAFYLKNPEVIFITGGSDKKLCLGPEEILIGPGVYHNIIEDMTGRKPHCLAKPSSELGDYIQDKFGITDPSKVLFIGDSVPEDMGFATNCGFHKLLVLSGLTTKQQVEKWEFPENYKPEFFADSLKVLQNILTQT